MKYTLSMSFLSAFAAVMPAQVLANEACVQLPVSLQTVGVSHISEMAELQRLDEQVESYLVPCMGPVRPENRKAICANGRVVAEQALRVVARIDEAGKKNAFLSNAKMKSYKTGVALLERMKKLSSDKTCV